jgi:Fur family transcriptional regulator, ferric uptake regulator
MERINNILKANQLSTTESRRAILQLFINANGALSHASIEKSTASAFDRVTVYRTLQSFVEKGIIHNIPTVDNTVLYALCKTDACQQNGHHHHDNHVHFLCTRCNTTTCLDNVTTPSVTLPQGFTPTHAQMVVEGICKNC